MGGGWAVARGGAARGRAANGGDVENFSGRRRRRIRVGGGNRGGGGGGFRGGDPGVKRLLKVEQGGGGGGFWRGGALAGGCLFLRGGGADPLGLPVGGTSGVLVHGGAYGIEEEDGGNQGLSRTPLHSRGRSPLFGAFCLVLAGGARDVGGGGGVGSRGGWSSWRREPFTNVSDKHARSGRSRSSVRRGRRTPPSGSPCP